MNKDGLTVKMWTVPGRVYASNHIFHMAQAVPEKFFWGFFFKVVAQPVDTLGEVPLWPLARRVLLQPNIQEERTRR